MEKIIEVTETVTKKIHTFECDECGCIVGESEEYPGDPYFRYGMCELRVLTPNGTYDCYDKCLCENCKDAFFATVKQTLEGLGFVYHEEV